MGTVLFCPWCSSMRCIRDPSRSSGPFVGVQGYATFDSVRGWFGGVDQSNVIQVGARIVCT
jgi:hypothetical protein